MAVCRAATDGTLGQKLAEVNSRIAVQKMISGSLAAKVVEFGF
jgi:hypothetical protein